MNKVSELDRKIVHALSKGEEKIRISEGMYENLMTKLKDEGVFLKRSHKSEIKNNHNRIGWRETMKIRFTKKSFSLASIILIIGIFMSVTGLTYANAKSLFKTDKIDYPFIDDSSVIGKWESVDYVKSIDQFSPDKKIFDESLYLKELVFIKGGKMLTANNTGKGNLGPTNFTWTKGLVLNLNQKTASKYSLKEIEGITYMFFEWKSGDYSIWGREPKYYVLKKVDILDYSKFEVKKIIDNTDYPFVADPEVLGNWESVDLVKTIDEFSTTQSKWLFDLFLKKMIFEKDGEVTQVYDKNQKQKITWTKGLVLDNQVQTASKYVIKEIEGETYLFYGWKNGDYILRGLEPQYYVLKKVK